MLFKSFVPDGRQTRARTKLVQLIWSFEARVRIPLSSLKIFSGNSNCFELFFLGCFPLGYTHSHEWISGGGGLSLRYSSPSPVKLQALLLTPFPYLVFRIPSASQIIMVDRQNQSHRTHSTQSRHSNHSAAANGESHDQHSDGVS